MMFYVAVFPTGTGADDDGRNACTQMGILSVIVWLAARPSSVLKPCERIKVDGLEVMALSRSVIKTAVQLIQLSLEITDSR